MMLHCDTQSAIHLVKNKIYHMRTKHIDVRIHKFRELIESEEINQHNVHTDENTINMLMKTVTTNKFKHCLELAKHPGEGCARRYIYEGNENS